MQRTIIAVAVLATAAAFEPIDGLPAISGAYTSNSGRASSRR